jgi:hypothetical protein
MTVPVRALTAVVAVEMGVDGALEEAVAEAVAVVRAGQTHTTSLWTIMLVDLNRQMSSRAAMQVAGSQWTTEPQLSKDGSRPLFL